MTGDTPAEGLPLNVLQRLSALQAEHGWLSDETLARLSREERIPLYALSAVTSFYPHYRRAPPPKATVGVCRDAACHLRGAKDLRESLARRFSARTDVEVQGVSCLGRCEVAPAVAINDVPVAPADADRVAAMAEGKAPLPADEPTTTPRRWQTDPYPPGAPRYGVLRRLLAQGEAAIAKIPDELTAAGLQGMGGAGFPTGRKWTLVKGAAGAPKYVVCNADESEPGTFKDRVILEELPHLVIEGMLLACRVIGADTAIVYIRHEYGREKKALQRAIAAAEAEGVLAAAGVRSLTIFTSPGGYILGEETALLEALEGRRGEPRNKPPFPGTHGLYGKPTLMNNVETFAHIPRILLDGGAAWKARGKGGAAGLKFLSLCGDVERPGVYEVPAGTTVRELIDVHGGGVRGVGGARGDGKRAGKAAPGRLLAFSPGGSSTAFLPASKVDAPLSWEGLRAAGSALGSGAVFVVAEGRDLLGLAANVVQFFRNESCGKCVPCRVGSEKAVDILERVLAGSAPRAALSDLAPLHETLAQTSICGLGQVALVPAMSVLENLPAEVDRRLGPQ
jgi:NADH:ubiquinone oxidoreductase subunit F (NADH-binding)/NADH:ubiquinone oxidoreductase subunit E